MATSAQLTQEILARCNELGFAIAGVAEVAPSRWAEQLQAWLGQNKHGEMWYMAEHAQLRIDPAVMVSGAQSIICVADRYHTGGRDRLPKHSPHGRVARYARGDDYHRVMKKRLFELCDELQERFPDETFRVCVDTAPVLEREFAQRAGIGAVGKNTMLIQQGIGSYLLLGEVITTLALEPTPDADNKDPCGTCTRCIDACPTGAITPWSVDATRCISYLTIEHRSTIDPQYHRAMGDWIFGCDICQEVCPHNQPTWRSRQHDVHEAYKPRNSGFDLLEVLSWSEDDRRSAFTRSALKRAKLNMMKRNALIAAGNSFARDDDPALRQRIVEIAADPDEDAMVQQTAQQVMQSPDWQQSPRL